MELLLKEIKPKPVPTRDSGEHLQPIHQAKAYRRTVDESHEKDASHCASTQRIPVRSRSRTFVGYSLR